MGRPFCMAPKTELTAYTIKAALNFVFVLLGLIRLCNFKQLISFRHHPHGIWNIFCYLLHHLPSPKSTSICLFIYLLYIYTLYFSSLPFQTFDPCIDLLSLICCPFVQNRKKLIKIVKFDESSGIYIFYAILFIILLYFQSIY